MTSITESDLTSIEETNKKFQLILKEKIIEEAIRRFTNGESKFRCMYNSDKEFGEMLMKEYPALEIIYDGSAQPWICIKKL